MTVNELIKILKDLPQDAMVSFIEPEKSSDWYWIKGEKEDIRNYLDDIIYFGREPQNDS